MKAESFALVVRALAALLWPSVVFIGLVMFRAQLRELVGRVAKARFPGVELDLSPLVLEAEELSAEAEQRGLDPELVTRLDRMEQQIKLVASTNPTSRLGPPVSRFYGGGEIAWPASTARVVIKDDGSRLVVNKDGSMKLVKPDPPPADEGDHE